MFVHSYSIQPLDEEADLDMVDQQSDDDLPPTSFDEDDNEVIVFLMFIWNGIVCVYTRVLMFSQIAEIYFVSISEALCCAECFIKGS